MHIQQQLYSLFESHRIHPIFLLWELSLSRGQDHKFSVNIKRTKTITTTPSLLIHNISKTIPSVEELLVAFCEKEEEEEEKSRTRLV
jgi:hypothetical protein